MFDQTWTRPFHWGVLIICDSLGPIDLPELQKGQIVGATDNCILVSVRHAQDFDTEGMDLAPDDIVPWSYVTVRCATGREPKGAVQFIGSVQCSSGKLTLGDADESVEVEVKPGRVALAISYSPNDFPEIVNVWIVGA